MTAPALVRQADVKRILKGARASGYDEVRLRIDPNGTMELIAGRGATTPAPVELE